MEPLTSAFDEERWMWRRPKLWSRRFELQAGTRVLAALETRAWVGATMHGTSVDGAWSIRHVGLLRGRVVVRSARAGGAEGAEDVALEFRPRWFGAGDVHGAGMAPLRWHRADFWGRRWELVDAGGLARITFTRTPAFLSPDAEVRVSEAARTDPHLVPLVMLGYYLIVLMVRQNAAAVS